MQKLSRYLDDLLLLAGCAAILRGISFFSMPLTWIIGGLMLIGYAFLIGKVVK